MPYIPTNENYPERFAAEQKLRWALMDAGRFFYNIFH